MEEKRPGEYFPVYEDEAGSHIYNSKDLCTIEFVDKILDAGVSTLKLEGRMKSHKGATVHRDWSRPSGHQVMISSTVVRILVTDGTHNGHLVHDLGKIGHLITKMHARHTGLHGAELTTYLLGSIGLRVKTLIMGWPTILPYEYTIHWLC